MTLRWGNHRGVDMFKKIRFSAFFIVIGLASLHILTASWSVSQQEEIIIGS